MEISVARPKTKSGVVSQVIDNIKEQKRLRISLAMTVLHGKVQSGKTEATAAICETYYNEFRNTPLITLTYPSKHLWWQLEHDYKDVAKPIKLQQLDDLLRDKKDQFESLMKKHLLLIVEEADFANGHEGKLQRVFSELDSATNTNGSAYNIHILFVGATNYHILLSELYGELSIKINHIRLPVGDDYFGVHEMVENGNIIDIGNLHTGDYAINNGKFTPKLWKIFDESFKGFDSGLSCFKIRPKDNTNTTISLCNKIAKTIKNKYKDFIVYKAYDTDNGSDLIKNAIVEAQLSARDQKVVLIMIDGLGAGVRLNQTLKDNDLLRFAYDTNSVASTAGQGLLGRYSGYYKNKKTETYFKPTFKILVEYGTVDTYEKLHNMIDSGKVTLDGVSDYAKQSTHLIHRVTERSYIPAKFISMGKVVDLGLTLKDVQTKKANGVVRKKLKDDANTVMECSHKKDMNNFVNKWNAALKGKEENHINLLDIAYAYYATDDMKQFVYLFNMAGDYIKYECVDRTKNKTTESKRTIRNKSLYTNTFI